MCQTKGSTFQLNHSLQVPAPLSPAGPNTRLTTHCIQYFTTVNCCIYLGPQFCPPLLMFGHSCIYMQVPALSPAEANTRLLHSIFHHSELLHVFGAQILGTAAYIWTLLHISAGTSFISCRAKHGTTAFNISPQYTWALLLMFGYCCLYLDTAAYIWVLLLIFGHCYICLGTVAYIWALLLIIGH